VTAPREMRDHSRMDPITSIDRYVPDYAHACEVCGTTPVVAGMKDERLVYLATMCGPCLWNEPKAADPATWNEASSA
jgi:hypothetical protein